MNKDKLLFYHIYEDFYAMAAHSPAFRAYCEAAFGADFSQDGFSDLRQIDFVLSLVSLGEGSRVLDIGCGNGKMLGYVQQKTGAAVEGFDYSDNAIRTARQRAGERASFQVGVIGEIEYPPARFDLITSMDTMYFAPDMTAFAAQIFRWLRPGGHFICGYQEGDLMKKTPNADTTLLAAALGANQIAYEVIDYTRQTYDMLVKKRAAILGMKDAFQREGQMRWYRIVEAQTKCAKVPFEKYRAKNARYLYVVKKSAGL